MNCITITEAKAKLGNEDFFVSDEKPYVKDDSQWAFKSKNFGPLLSDIIDTSDLIIGPENAFAGYMIWVIKIGIYPESEMPIVIDRIRNSFQEFRPIEDAPVFVFEKHEFKLAKSLIRLLLEFGWDAFCCEYPALSRVAFCVSHENFIEVGKKLHLHPPS